MSAYLETHRFFADTSPWNTRIAADATYRPVPSIETYDTGLVSWGEGGGTIAIYYAKQSDPLEQMLYNADTWQNVNDGRWQRAGNSMLTEREILAVASPIDPLPGNPYSTQHDGLHWNTGGLPARYQPWHQTAPLYVRVPTDAVPAPDGDGHTVIMQPDGQALEMYSPIRLSSGEWVAEKYGFTDARHGMGVGAENGRRASMVASYAGVLRDLDVTQGHIDHALAVVVPAAMLARTFTAPATAFDSSSDDYAGTLPMGTRLALPRETNIDELELQSSLGAEIARAARDYGMYVVDRGGGGISLSVQYAPKTPALARWDRSVAHDLDIIIHTLQQVHE